MRAPFSGNQFKWLDFWFLFQEASSLILHRHTHRFMYSITSCQFWAEPTSSYSDDDGWVCWVDCFNFHIMVVVRTTYTYWGAIKTILWRVYRKFSYRKCWINGNVIKVYINLLTLIKMKGISSMNEVKIHIHTHIHTHRQCWIKHECVALWLITFS
jgi:hypothetical protein